MKWVKGAGPVIYKFKRHPGHPFTLTHGHGHGTRQTAADSDAMKPDDATDRPTAYARPEYLSITNPH